MRTIRIKLKTQHGYQDHKTLVLAEKHAGLLGGGEMMFEFLDRCEVRRGLKRLKRLEVGERDVITVHLGPPEDRYKPDYLCVAERLGPKLFQIGCVRITARQVERVEKWARGGR